MESIILSERRTFRFLVSVTLLALAFILGLMVYLSQGPKRCRDLVTRSATRTFAGLGETIGVELRVDPTCASRSWNLPADGRSLDVVIGLDNSMTLTIDAPGVNALERIKVMVRSLIGHTDLSRHRMSLVRMDEGARAVQGLTSSRSALHRAVASLPEGNKTQVPEGLEAMSRALAVRRGRPGDLALAFLVSDGRARASETQVAARKLRGESGVFVVPIGFGEVVYGDLLRSISSFPTEYLETSSPEELVAIYRGWIAKMERLVALDVRIEERINRPMLSLAREVAVDPPAVEVTEDRIAWTLPLLTAEPRLLRYGVTTMALGWHSIDRTPGRVTLRPVDGELLSLPIRRSPKLIVAASWLWMSLTLSLVLAVLVWLLQLGARGRS